MSYIQSENGATKIFWIPMVWQFGSTISFFLEIRVHMEERGTERERERDGLDLLNDGRNKSLHI